MAAMIYKNELRSSMEKPKRLYIKVYEHAL